jgi:hypothetical protein
MAASLAHGSRKSLFGLDAIGDGCTDLGVSYGGLTDAISPRSLRCSPKFN